MRTAGRAAVRQARVLRAIVSSLSVARAYRFEFATGLRHERALRIGEDEMLEMDDGARDVALPAKRARPFEIGLGGLGSRAVLREYSLPERDRRTILPARALH